MLYCYEYQTLFVQFIMSYNPQEDINLENFENLEFILLLVGNSQVGMQVEYRNIMEGIVEVPYNFLLIHLCFHQMVVCIQVDKLMEDVSFDFQDYKLALVIYIFIHVLYLQQKDLLGLFFLNNYSKHVSFRKLVHIEYFFLLLIVLDGKLLRRLLEL